MSHSDRLVTARARIERHIQMVLIGLASPDIQLLPEVMKMMRKSHRSLEEAKSWLDEQLTEGRRA